MPGMFPDLGLPDKGGADPAAPSARRLRVWWRLRWAISAGAIGGPNDGAPRRGETNGGMAARDRSDPGRNH